MSGGLQHSAGVAVCLLSVAVAVLHASSCDFDPSCRPGETYRLAIPCEGKCTNYVQCTDGDPIEKKCGKWFFSQTRFDPVKLDCVRGDVDCDWWKKIVTTTVAPSTTSSTAAPSTTPAPQTTTSAPASSTESTSTTSSSTVTPDSTAQPSSTSAVPSTTDAPTSSPSPAESAAAPVAAALGPALLAAALAMLL